MRPQHWQRKWSIMELLSYALFRNNLEGKLRKKQQVNCIAFCGDLFWHYEHSTYLLDMGKNAIMSYSVTLQL